nr:retrovirus-related Pol polyprotein from transposon TNT 1-94 [Tanacetum cinerariifolium]
MKLRTSFSELPSSVQSESVKNDSPFSEAVEVLEPKNKGGSYFAIVPQLEVGKFKKWKKRILCYLTGIEPYYITCMKDDPFQPKTAEGANKPEAQWSNYERRVVNQIQRLESIIISCIPDDIIESVISCETAKDTWNDLVHNFEGLSDTKKNKIMDLKSEYNNFRAKPSKSIS